MIDVSVTYIVKKVEWKYGMVQVECNKITSSDDTMPNLLYLQFSNAEDAPHAGETIKVSLTKVHKLDA